MRTAEEKGKRARTDGAEEDGGEPIDRALQLSIEKLQGIQDEIEKFLSHPVLGDLLTEDDQQICKHLESIFVDESEDIKSGCSITLTFSSNPYFEDKKLTKTYSMSDDGTVTVEATSIKWKAGMVCTKKGEKRLLVDQSFFTWFNAAENGSFAHGEMDQVADIIKEDLWPNPLKYFNNELESEFEQEGDEEGSDEEESEDEDEDGGDEEET
ncbi:hypothetical protein PAHAL_7G177100 [Panicum hallii]|uniref:Uncharacterized protein n=1 Tax=Panicum hallii TaxID=206008 RepID=A0A2S3I7B8_9POAL|nr:hypothetical protein PAHAL_7G177100 [Panicum hallii]